MSAQQRDSPFQVASTPGPFVCLAGSAGFGHGHHGQGGELIVQSGRYKVCIVCSKYVGYLVSVELTAPRTHKKGGRSEVADVDRMALLSMALCDVSEHEAKPTMETGMPFRRGRHGIQVQ